MISIIFVPYIAVPFYFLIGIRKREPKHKKEYLKFHTEPLYEYYTQEDNDKNIFHILDKNGIPPATKGHTFELITSSTDAFHKILEEIKEAKYSIDICTYVFLFDKTTHVLFDALVERAKEGVKVRLLLDTVGSLGLYFNQKPLSVLREAGGEVAFFTSLLKRPYLNYISLRNHRKMYIFDQVSVLSGGMNMSDEYMGEAEDHKRYKDLLYRLKGPSVAYFYHIFHSDWVYAVKVENKTELPHVETYDGEDIVQVVPSGPDIPTDALYESLLNALYCAKKRIWIVTPYFVPDEHIMQALIIAYRKGLDIKLITPKESDHLFVDLVRMPYLRELHNIGIEVLLYEDAMLHAKAILIDDIGGMVGTVNLDNRSLFFNYEIVTFVYSEQFIHSMDRWMKELITRSNRGIEAPSKSREAVENIMKVFAPIL